MIQRPFVNYYGPVFILYELSTPFLNVHWFCDKLDMTGSKLQWYNGVTLLATFFGSRLVWGTYQSVRVFQAIWQLLGMQHAPLVRDLHSSAANSIFVPRDGQLCAGKETCVMAQSEVMKFANHTMTIPMWLALTYLGSNLVLHSLNFYWFGRMIETVRKRFEDKPKDEKTLKRERTQSIIEELADGLDENEISGPKTDAADAAAEKKELANKADRADRSERAEKTEDTRYEKNSNSATSTAVPDGGTEISKRRKDL